MRYIRPIRNDLDLFDDTFEDFFKQRPPMPEIMKTDIREEKDNYVFDLEIPGYKKENISIEFEEGYLTVIAKKVTESSNENKNAENEENRPHFIRKERFMGTLSRKFYVGKINEEDIKASYTDGILTLVIPKESKKIETKKMIAIN